MCFLVVHHLVHPTAPLLVLATRDERYARTFAPPQAWHDAPGVFAPRDLEAGGTWIGTNTSGLVVAITNRGRPRPELAGRSRGLLVRDLLLQDSAGAALAMLREHLPDHAYEGFHLLLADREAAFAVRRDAVGTGQALGAADVSDWAGGSHTLSSLHEPDEAAVPAELLPPSRDLASWIERHEVLSRDDTPRLPRGGRILKRSPDGLRGTVCAAIIHLPPDDAAGARWRFAAGSPDQVVYTTPPPLREHLA